MTNGSSILLTGGTGKIGTRLASILSSNGYHTIVASRSGSFNKLPNAEGIKFDWFDSNTFTAPFEGGRTVSAIFLIAPPLLYPFPTMKPFIDLAISKGVNRFVLLNATSVEVGADIIMGKPSEYVIAKGVDYAILRPTWFMENFTEQRHYSTVMNQDQIITATGSGKCPFVAADDIAAVAFRALTDEKSHNTEHFILGPESLSYDETAEILSKELGRKITHTQITIDQSIEAMKSFGIPEDYAVALTAMETMIKDGKEDTTNDVVFKVTGKKPLAFGEFARRNKAVWARE